MRSWYTSLLCAVILALVSVSFEVALCAQTPPSEPSLRETAAFLGALPFPESSPLYRLTQTAGYQTFAKSLQQDWDHFQRVIAEPMRGWAQTWMPEQPTQTVLYPFAGPDFLNAYLMYPRAKQYVLIGLEHGGNVPEFTDVPAETLAKGLTTFRTALKTLMYVNFFVTNRMAVEIDRASIPGVTPVVLATMARLDLTPLAIRPMQVDRGGHIADIPTGAIPRESKWGGYESVEVRFRGPDGDERLLIYLSMDLSDRALKAHPHWMAFYHGLGEVSGLLKAGSYLMHSRNFSTIRGIMLAQAKLIVQDDSGIPVAQFQTAEWTLTPFGFYTVPIARFRDKAQPDLRELYAKGAEPLPFPWGYGNARKQTNLLLARRKPQS